MFCRIALWYCQGTLFWPVRVFFFNCNVKWRAANGLQNYLEVKELLSLELLIIIIIIRYNFFTAGLQNFGGRGWHVLPRFGINI